MGRSETIGQIQNLQTQRPVICLTPVKNEAWILESFLTSASQWADTVIIADQFSTDGSREIANRCVKVALVENNQEAYNELDRQKLLINTARSISESSILVTLDADEFFSPGFQDTEDWTRIINAPPGTVFSFRWLNIYPDLEHGWFSDGYFPWVLVDDGSPHRGTPMHSVRVPINPANEPIQVNDFYVLHLQYVDWARMQSKQRYYQCLERIKNPKKPSIDVYRMYHHMYDLSSKLIPLPEEIRSCIGKIILELNEKEAEESYWFDDEVMKYLDTYGPGFFRKENIWARRWPVKDPRKLKDRLVHAYMKYTQKFTGTRVVHRIDRYLRFHY